MTLEQLTERALHIKTRYDELNVAEGRRAWTREEYVLGFLGDVGDLAKLVLAAEGARGDVSGGREALGHELADCLWWVLVLAELYDVPLGEAFDRLIEDLDERLEKGLRTA